MWIIEVTGERPGTGGNPGWRRHGRLPKDFPPEEVSMLLGRLLSEHTAARATLDGFELLTTRRLHMAKKTDALTRLQQALEDAELL